MILKALNEFDIVNYKKASMFIGMPNCSFKCDKECGEQVCQNSALATSPDIKIDIPILVFKYLNNPLTSAIVIGGLEPFDSINDLMRLIDAFRQECEDDIVIYTGYTEEEINIKFPVDYDILHEYKNIIIKFGRYIPNQQSHYDKVLGIKLASDNQYAKRIMDEK